MGWQRRCVQRWLGCALACLAFGEASALSETTGLPRGRIANIRLIRHKIFDPSLPSENAPLHRLINRLHIDTQEIAIRQQLLFKTGDVFDPKIAEETERALRQWLRLRDVRVHAVEGGPEQVDVIVETHETWTTEPFVGFSGSGSQRKYVAGLRERNLVGYGKEVGLLYKDDGENTSRALTYTDPAFLGTRLRLWGQHEDTSDGSARVLWVERPFFSSVAPWGFRLGGSYKKSKFPLYDKGKEMDSFDREDRTLGGTGRFSVGSTVHTIRRLGMGYRFFHHELTHSSGPPRWWRDGVYHLFGPTWEYQKIDFITAHHIRLQNRDEDFNLGTTWTGHLEVSQARWFSGARNATFLENQWGQGHLWGPGHFAWTTLKTAGRYENGWQDQRTHLRGEYYNHARPWRTWAGHVTWEQIFRPEPDASLTLGALTGLRGYPENQFNGNRLFVANLESRLFFANEVYHFFGVGAVGFADLGTVWPRGAPVKAADLRADYGLGLRIYLNRTSQGQVLRFDVAWPTRAIEGKRSPIFTFGTGQVF